MNGFREPPDDEHRCHGTVKRTGERCKKWAVASGVCQKHGVNAATRAKAEREEQQGKALEAARRLDVDVSQFDGDPVAAMRNLIARGQGEVERFGRLVARFEDADVKYTGRSGVEQLRAEFGAYRAERDSLGRALELMLKADVARMIASRGKEREETEEVVVTVLDQAVTNVAFRHGHELDPLALHDEILGEFRAIARMYDPQKDPSWHPASVT